MCTFIYLRLFLLLFCKKKYITSEHKNFCCKSLPNKKGKTHGNKMELGNKLTKIQTSDYTFPEQKIMQSVIHAIVTKSRLSLKKNRH